MVGTPAPVPLSCGDICAKRKRYIPFGMRYSPTESDIFAVQMLKAGTPAPVPLRSIRRDEHCSSERKKERRVVRNIAPDYKVQGISKGGKNPPEVKIRLPVHITFYSLIGLKFKLCSEA